MYTVYKLNVDELNEDLLQSIKTLFHDKIIEIAVCEADAAGRLLVGMNLGQDGDAAGHTGYIGVFQAKGL
jgi:hypothetical protein